MRTPRAPLVAARRSRDVDTLVVTGTVTNVCVEHSARRECRRPAADACVATRDQDHNTTLHVVRRCYGDVRPTDEVLALVAVGRSGG